MISLVESLLKRSFTRFALQPAYTYKFQLKRTKDLSESWVLADLAIFSILLRYPTSEVAFFRILMGKINSKSEFPYILVSALKCWFILTWENCQLWLQSVLFDFNRLKHIQSTVTVVANKDLICCYIYLHWILKFHRWPIFYFSLFFMKKLPLFIASYHVTFQ